MLPHQCPADLEDARAAVPVVVLEVVDVLEVLMGRLALASILFSEASASSHCRPEGSHR
jgi:hypothetical protein